MAALILSGAAFATPIVRCGTDSFGNLVCLDQRGVMSTVPTWRDDIPASSVNDSEAARNRQQQRDEGVPPKRCGTDSFGNRVCQ
ncbi:MAG: hypothetical protein PHP57_09055 [Sideroxydans sp.]|nr:hypothetical protein [Sideroxydans sp.]